MSKVRIVKRYGPGPYKFGIPKPRDIKVFVGIRVRNSVLEAFQASGPSWRLLMHEALEREAKAMLEAAREVAGPQPALKEPTDLAAHDARVAMLERLAAEREKLKRGNKG